MIDPIQAVFDVELFRQELPDLFSTDATAIASGLHVLDCATKGFFLCLGQPLRAPVMGYARQPIKAAMAKPL